MSDQFQNKKIKIRFVIDSFTFFRFVWLNCCITVTLQIGKDTIQRKGERKKPRALSNLRKCPLASTNGTSWSLTKSLEYWHFNRNKCYFHWKYPLRFPALLGSKQLTLIYFQELHGKRRMLRRIINRNSINVCWKMIGITIVLVLECLHNTRRLCLTTDKRLRLVRFVG